MLKHECALATAEPWLFKINRVLTGSRVLLYANRIGIIAIGIATAEKRNIELDGGSGRIVRLRDFRKLKASLPAASIRAIAGDNYPLLQTLRKLPDDIGEKLLGKMRCFDMTATRTKGQKSSKNSALKFTREAYDLALFEFFRRSRRNFSPA